MRFTIDGELPSLNEYIRAERGNKYAAAGMKRRTQNDILHYIRRAKMKPVTPPVWLTYRYYCKDRRKDKDNIAGVAHKFVQDALVAAGILRDDGWDYIAGFTDEFELDKKHPRIEVTIDEVIP